MCLLFQDSDSFSSRTCVKRDNWGLGWLNNTPTNGTLSQVAEARAAIRDIFTSPYRYADFRQFREAHSEHCRLKSESPIPGSPDGGGRAAKIQGLAVQANSFLARLQ